MAVTSIWPIKGRVDKVINYARNPEKTHDKERLSGLHEIEGVVEYAADEMKTEKRAQGQLVCRAADYRQAERLPCRP